MLPDLCFFMTLHDERGGVNQMLLQLCFSMTLHDEKGGPFIQNAVGLLYAVI